MFYTIKLKKHALILLLTIIAIICTVFCAGEEGAAPVFSYGHENCLVIDAGHGGIDGGAIGINGAKESNINLDIALKLRAISSLYGFKTVMTRVSDSIGKDAASYSEHDELVRRTEIANNTKNAVLISVHQNCYPTSQPSGAQVLYSKTDGSETLGKVMHDNIINYLEPDNRRVAEPASEKLYITSHVICPAVLVECGFMSNFSDLQKLSDSAYQTQLSAVIFASYKQFIDFKH